VVANWTKLLTRAITDEHEAWAATADDHRKKRPRASLLNWSVEHRLPQRRLLVGQVIGVGHEVHGADPSCSGSRSEIGHAQ
jgi:hypothetical protein